MLFSATNCTKVLCCFRSCHWGPLVIYEKGVGGSVNQMTPRSPPEYTCYLTLRSQTFAQIKRSTIHEVLSRPSSKVGQWIEYFHVSIFILLQKEYKKKKHMNTFIDNTQQKTADPKLVVACRTPYAIFFSFFDQQQLALRLVFTLFGAIRHLEFLPFHDRYNHG